jgi:hypothetical protein
MDCAGVAGGELVAAKVFDRFWAACRASSNMISSAESLFAVAVLDCEVLAVSAG